MKSDDPWIRALVILCVLLAALGLMFALWLIGSAFSDIVLLFFLAWALALVIEPSAAMLVSNGKLPRPIAVSVVYLGVFVLIIVGALIVTPLLVTQIVQIIGYLPTLIDFLNDQLLALYAELQLRGVYLDLESAARTYDVTGRLEAVIPLILSNIVGAASGVANAILQGALLVMISFYLTLDGRRVAHGAIELLPDRYGDDARYLMESARSAFFGFLKGNMIMAVAYAIGTAGIMMVAGLPYVLLTSITAGICAVIPFIGGILALIIPIIIVLIAQSGSGIFVLIASVILQQIVYNVVGPRAMSQTIGLHPLLMFLVFLVGARVAGVWGAFFGIPIAAAALSMLRFYRIDRPARRNEVNRGDDSSTTPLLVTQIATKPVERGEAQPQDRRRRDE